MSRVQLAGSSAIKGNLNIQAAREACCQFCTHLVGQLQSQTHESFRIMKHSMKKASNMHAHWCQPCARGRH